MTADSSHTETDVARKAAALSGARARADGALRVFGIITLASVAIQIGLAGLGAFGGSFAPHTILGLAIGWLTLAMMIAALVARPSRSVVLASIVLFLLAFGLQPVLAATAASPWLGALHALDAMVIFGLTGWLVGGAASRGRARRL